ncbi:MAG TPA: LLM class flavin-dependent oxidoreductase, partial [Microbacteriaceae bacterium]|nr:LLM class flavin-dependent oxidoreductase [Microbacteriaceae bacterium]
MFEAIEIIKRLFATAHSGRDTRFSGNYFTLESTRLWTAPETPPQILVATAGPVTARRAGRSADGLITTNAPPEKLAALLERFATGAREAGKNPASMPRVIQWHVSLADTLAEAEATALREWPNGGMRFSRADIRSPQDFAHLARTVRIEDFENHVFISPDAAAHRQKLTELARLGFSHVYVHHVGRDQRAFIERFGAEVLRGDRA